MKTPSANTHEMSFFDPLQKQSGEVLVNRSKSICTYSKKRLPGFGPFTRHPAFSQPARMNGHNMNKPDEKCTVLDTMAGMVRSIIFLNWKDFA